MIIATPNFEGCISIKQPSTVKLFVELLNKSSYLHVCVMYMVRNAINSIDKLFIRMQNLKCSTFVSLDE